MMISSMQNKIQVLPQDVAEKIAAGEIVDRPVSIVKELIENAIDSGADQIIAEIRNGGKTYIRITDNGSGIERDDVEIAFQRHATSKISSVDDLNSILTLGFRGEALASIAAVSKVEMITKTKTSRTGTRICISGGKCEELSETGCPDGTTVIIKDLFFNVPARHKFLKADSAESGLIIDLISKIALAYPEIRFRLINNEVLLFSTTGRGDIHTNILTIYSKEFGSDLIQIDRENDLFKIKAFVTPIGSSKSNRRFQIYFVNGRYVVSKVIDNAIMNAYKEKIMDGRYPAAFIFLYVDPNKLDVNIHPNKKEVRFDNEQQLAISIADVITEHLNTPDAIPVIRSTHPIITERKSSYDADQVVVDINKLFETKRQQSEIEQPMISFDPPMDEHIRENDSDDDSASFLVNLQVTGSIFNTYITAISGEYFYLIDQHAAHERIFYEKLMEQHRSEIKHSQKVLTPYIVEVTHSDKSQESTWINVLLDMGFEMEPFGVKSYIVKAVPLFMAIEDSKRFIADYLDQYSEQADIKDLKKIERIIMNSCKNAVKAHDALSMEEMRRLVKDLSEIANPFTCPHGRPVFLRLGRHDIEKMFKRL